MGRKKRKVVEDSLATAATDMGLSDGIAMMSNDNNMIKMEGDTAASDPRFPPPPSPPIATATNSYKIAPSSTSAATAAAPSINIKSATMATTQLVNNEDDFIGSAKPSSQYGLQSHSGDLVEEDIYVSDGSLSSSSSDDDAGETTSAEAADEE